MVKHIVLFKLKSGLSLEEKSDLTRDFKLAIEQLPEVIGFIKHVEVGANINASEHFDIALYSEFESLDRVKEYSVHPKHIEASGIIKPYIEVRSCVDYEY